ncbi:myosin-11-like [Bacillus rossius redtenbacheri]|uniref:myosin-11-like n=1 Tax=Bacillus rossius redtenbacheri TaxID=93214 RepID=UPI002FDD6F8E
MELHRQLQKADMAVSDAQLKVTNMRKQLYEAKPDGLASDKATRLHQEVTELKRQLELSQSKLHKAQKEVSNQSEIIELMTDSANVHSSIISDLEGRIQAYEKEIIGNEEKIKILSTALADEKRESASLQEAAASSQQQLQQLKGKDVDHGSVAACASSHGVPGARQLTPDCFLRDCVIKNLHLDVNEISLQYRDCYSEVVRQEDILSTLRDENLELRVQTYQLRQEVGRLEAKLAHLSKEAAKGRKEAISESQKQSQALIKELELCREQNELLKNNEEASDTKLVNLQVQISCLSEENKTLQERLEISTSVVHELEGSVRDWSERAEELTAEVSSLRETDRKNEVLLSDCELDKQDLAKELDECSAQLSRYASKLHSVVVERDELKQRLDAANKSVGEVAELEAKLRSLHDDLTFATETVQGQEEVIEKLTGEKAACAEELEDVTRKLVCLESEAKTLRQTVSDQQDELKEMKDATNEVVQLEREVTNLREELVSARTQLAKKENQIRTLTSGKTADAAVTSELENTRRACAQLTAEGEAKSEELMDMVTKLEKAESELRRLCLSEEEMYRALSACESMLSEREARLHDLQQRLVDVEREKVTRLKRASSDLMRPKLCNETLRKSLEAKLRGLTRSEEEIRILKSQIKAQQEELEAYKSLELQYQQLMIQADSQALREVSVELHVWAQQNAALQMEVHTLQKRNDRLALDLRLAQKALQDSANTNLVAQRSYSKQVQDLSQASLQHQVLLKQFSDKAEQLQEEVATLQTTKAALLDRNSFLEKSSSSLLSELRGLKSRVQEHEQQVQSTHIPCFIA